MSVRNTPKKSEFFLIIEIQSANYLTLLTADVPGDVGVPDHSCISGAVHLSGISPSLNQTSLSLLISVHVTSSHPLLNSLHITQLLHARYQL